jgi:ATP-binding cassette subfamily C protein CydCD
VSHRIARPSTTTQRGPRRLLAAGPGTGRSGTLYLLGLTSAVKAAALVVLAEALARGIVAVIAGGDIRWPVVLGLAAALIRGAATWATTVFAVRAAIGVKETLRGELAARLLEPGPTKIGAMTALATQGLDDLDDYFTKVLPAVMASAVVPLIIGTRILAADWVSAVVIVATLPLVPVFMALIGMHTKDTVSAAIDALARLSDHLVELARGLPVLVGLGRVEEQTKALQDISEDYRRRTMATLRTAFLSSLALELISTLSVAIVAVFVGFRLVDGTMPLYAGLLVLVLAPECYAPFRELGASFHASQDGVLAYERARSIVEDTIGTDTTTTQSHEQTTHDVAPVSVESLTVTYADRLHPSLSPATFVFPPGSITVVRGPSGSGKTTLLTVLSGRVRDGVDGASITGTAAGVSSDRVAWAPQYPRCVAATVRQELLLYAGDTNFDIENATATLDDTISNCRDRHWELAQRVDRVMGDLRLSLVADASPGELSPGELQRVAVARALLRVEAGATLVLLDEPTAHLGHADRLAIESAIAALRGRATVVIASHDHALFSMADHLVELGHGNDQEETITDVSGVEAEGAFVADIGKATGPAISPSPKRPCSAECPRTVTTAKMHRLRVGAHHVREVVGSSAGQIVLGVLLGTLAALFAVSLTAVSGWLIVRASQQPAVLYLLVPVVGVRFFGIGRSVLRYAERLVIHDAVFASVTRLRIALWQALSARGASSRRLLQGASALDYLITTANTIRDLGPRVALPPMIGTITGLVSVIASWLLYAPAVPALAACIVLCLVVAPAVTLTADRTATVKIRQAQTRSTYRFAAMVAAANDLQANKVGGPVLASFQRHDLITAARARHAAWALGLGSALVASICCTASVLMLVVLEPAVQAGTLPAEVMAVLVLLPLGLLDPFVAVVEAVQQGPALLRAARKMTRFLPSSAGQPAPAVDGIEPHKKASPGTDLVTLDRVTVRWPQASTPVFSGLSATVTRGSWLVVTGSSGAGKSTLLTLLLGYLQPEQGALHLGNVDSRSMPPGDGRRRVAWCPQEGHIFDSTLRANLLIARKKNDPPTEAEIRDAADRAGLRDLIARLPKGLDTRIGSEGERLSGGERQRLAIARTLLTRADVVLLDEPTAHLDTDTATAVMAQLRATLAGKGVVLVTHTLTETQLGDKTLDLDHFRRDERAGSTDTVARRGDRGIRTHYM